MDALLRPLRTDDAADVLAAFSDDPEMERQSDVHDLVSAAKYIETISDADQGNCAFAVEVEDHCAGIVPEGRLATDSRPETPGLRVKAPCLTKAADEIVDRSAQAAQMPQ